MNIHDLYRPFMKFFRRRRMKAFCRSLARGAQTHVLDIGGSALIWSYAPFRPRLVIANLYRPAEPIDREVVKSGTTHWVVADGMQLPFRSSAFEMAFSNSVIEHLSSKANQEVIAAEVRRVGRGYHVQTPNRLFPVEPHLLTPFFHFLPLRLKRVVLPWTVWGLVAKPSPAQQAAFLAEVKLLDAREFMGLFPDGVLRRERVFGLTKSLIVQRTLNDDPSTPG